MPCLWITKRIFQEFVLLYLIVYAANTDHRSLYLKDGQLALELSRLFGYLPFVLLQSVRIMVNLSAFNASQIQSVFSLIYIKKNNIHIFFS